MNLREFKLERYFAEYEFKAQYLLSTSDCESMGLSELLALADVEGLELWNRLRLGYTQSQGHPLLREEIAGLYRGITAEDILVTVPEEGILIALSTVLQAGDHVIVIDPAYQSLYEIPRALNCSLAKWPLIRQDNRWTLDVDRLRSQINRKTKLIVINFPHNPTGFLPSQSELDALISLAREREIYLFSDEMYRLSEYDPDQRLKPVGSCYERGITLAGLSKSFGLPGLRMGWLMTKDRELLQALRSRKDYTTICSGAPDEILAFIALRAREQILAGNREIIKNNLAVARDFFAHYNRYFNWLPPQAGSVALAELTLNIPIERFCEIVLAKKNLLIAPGNVFELGGNFFRVGLGKKDFPHGLAKLGEYVQEFLV
ncbi:aminotransferases class-i pyridoxal-phosphate attachment site [Lucifera butyrica]|uniref:Aminotransferase n=1 Tax=Lucifera butyrica TaxID=1351585 RepID=A0A498R6E8_9FIRM|nr:aminotransferase class I/II-fold pyridoxal phosphate-dependent enzyme [Lucifera butyrica]VBB06759.1 aminotransferases class-i pyridoxal-phosphate attachment site [Lucifera butyrica]